MTRDQINAMSNTVGYLLRAATLVQEVSIADTLNDERMTAEDLRTCLKTVRYFIIHAEAVASAIEEDRLTAPPESVLKRACFVLNGYDEKKANTEWEAGVSAAMPADFDASRETAH